MPESDPQFSPDAITILAGLCSDEKDLQDRALDKLASGNVSWSALLPLAEQHHVYPLLYRGLKAAGIERANLTELEHAILRQGCRNIKMQNLRVEAEMHRISALLDSAGIAHLVYKGSALARQVFGDLGMRRFNDYDLITSRKNASLILSVMSAAGYTPIVPLNNIQNKKIRYFEKEITYIKDEDGQRRHEADIHWMLLRPALKVPLGFEQLWAQREEVQLDSKKCWVLNPTYAFLATCIHNGGNENWNTLKQVADVDAILRKWGSVIRWDEVWRTAGAYDLSLMVSTALMLTQRVFRTPLPAEAEIKARQNPVAIRRSIALSAFSHPDQYPHWSAIRQHMAMRSRVWTKARVVAHSVVEWLAPNYADEQFFPLPAAARFFGVYFFIRPLRILFSGRNADRFAP